MRIGSGAHTYEWIDDWAKVPDTESARNGWAHPGMAVNAADQVITFHAGDPTVLVFDQAGNLVRTIETGLIEGHGICLVREGSEEFLWIADNGGKNIRRPDRLEQLGGQGGKAVKLAMDGRVVQTIEAPDLPIYRENKFSPTAVAVYEERFGGNGDVWVTDGYGQSYVHRYSRFDKTGRYLGSINGEEGQAGRFAGPHSIWVDTRKDDAELYVADRSNKRIQVYDLEGHYKRAFGEGVFMSPSAFAAHGEVLVIAELHARVALLDREDKLISYLGENPGIWSQDGWPNMKDESGVAARTNRLESGKFNSPHGVGADSTGNIYVAEWLIGGRLVKLARV